MTPKTKSVLLTIMFLIAFIGFISLCVTFPSIMAPIMMAAGFGAMAYLIYNAFLLHFTHKDKYL